MKVGNGLDPVTEMGSLINEKRVVTVDGLVADAAYGYRPGKSALDAVGVTRQLCWKCDRVLEFDIKGLLEPS